MLSLDVLTWLLLLASCHLPAIQAMGLGQFHWPSHFSQHLTPSGQKRSPRISGQTEGH